METPTNHKQRRVKRLSVGIASLMAVVALLVGGAMLMLNRGNDLTVSSVGFEESLSPTRVDPLTTPDATPTSVPSQEPIVIEPGEVTDLYVPSDDPDLVINHRVFQMPTSCLTIIEPPLGTSDQGEVFQCGDFAMPSTSTEENVVLAGHSGRGIETVFNRLYPQGQDLVDRPVFLRTTTSGDQWLEYRVSAVYEPDKEDLPYMAEVWTPTPGRLILITCLQEDGLQESVRNSVVIADFVGVRSDL